MFKKVLLTLVLSLGSVAMWAQSMSDDQVMSYIKESYEAGNSQEQIAKGLLQKGATPEQLQRIKQMRSSSATSGKQTSTDNIKRLREPNGQTRPLEKMELEEDENEEENEDVKKIFGHDIFNSEKLTFQSNINIPAPQSYLLGPGDEVIVDIYGSTQLSNVMQVAPDGSVTIPDERPIYVAGLTLAQAQAKIRKAIGSNYVESTIKISLGQTRTVLVNVMGEVVTPGTYSLSAFSTVFNALYLAGGVNEIGTLRNIKVSRNGKIITTVDVYEFILNGRLPGNIMLQDDDVVIVGTYESLVKIEGNVKRPMYYEMKKNESLQSLLRYAGGFTGDAYREKIRVERRSREGLTVHNVDEWDFADFHNEDEDVVVVSPIIERYKNVVKVSGAVFRPGSYKLDGKANTVKTAIEQAGGLLEQAVKSRAVLLRLKEDRTLTTQSIPLQEILDGKLADIILQNEDELIISSYSLLTDGRKMSIYGEVMSPGEFDFSENTTIGDLITMAGGLNDVASLQKVEVARRITSDSDNSDGKQIAKVYIFNLDNNLNVVGNESFTLEPYDKVTVHRSPNHKPLTNVYITGEVMYEGIYTLSSKNDKLSELVKKAGGVTNSAFVKGAKLVRRYSEQEMNDRKRLLEVAMNKADSIAAFREMQKTSYMVGVDLTEAIENPNTDADIPLEEGDSIFVPSISNVVKISGEVLAPNTVVYRKNKHSKYYLNQAGGVSENGKKKKAYILYASGQVNTMKKGKIEPGCEIIVPSKIEKKTDTAKVSMWATLASTVATVGAIVATIVRK